MADDITTVLKFVGDAGNAEAAINRLIASLQNAAKQSANLFSQAATGGNQSSQNLNNAAAAADRAAASTKKAADSALAYAQASARLQAAQGNAAGAVQTLRTALEGVEQKTIAAVRAQTQLASIARRIDEETRRLASGLQLAGSALTTGLTLPLAALSAASVKSAVDIDQQVNTLKALTGGAANAEKRLAQLIATAQRTPGLTTSLAATLDAQLRVASVTEQTIDRILPAIGRLNAVSTLGDPQRFAQNLVQLVTQGFERTDLKELVGQSPLAGELIKQIFNVDSPTNAAAIRESAQRLGLTTTEAFFNAFAQAAANNPKLAAVSESIGAQFEKLRDRIALALRPLGLAILEAITPLVEAVVPVIEQVGKAFASLPRPVQATAIALGAVAAVTGPALIALAGLSQTVLILAEGWVALQAALAAGGALAALPTLLNPIALGVAAVAAAVGLAGLAWASYEDAAERAAKITTSAITSQQQQIDSLKSLQAQTEALASIQGGSVEQHQKLQAIIAQLDPDTRAYISSITNEQTAIAELNRVLRDQILLKQQGLSRNLADIGDASVELAQKLAGAERQLRNIKTLSDEFARGGGVSRSLAFDPDQGGAFDTQARSAEDFGRAISETQRQVDAARNSLQSFGSQVAAFINLNKLTVDGFVAQQLALGRTREQVDGMVAAYRAFQRQQESSAQSASATTSVIDQQRAAVDRLISSLDRLNQAANTKVDEGVRQIALTARGTAEAKAKLQQALKFDDDFFFAVEERKRVAKNLQALNEALDPTRRTGGGRSAVAAQRAETQDALRVLKLREQTAQRIAEAEIGFARRAFEDRRITIEQLEKLTVEAELRMLAAKEATFAEERRLVEASKLRKSEKDFKLAEIAEREASARQKAGEVIRKAEEETEKVRSQILEQASKARSDRQEEALKRDITLIQQAAEDRIISEEAAARKIAEIEEKLFNKRKALLLVDIAFTQEGTVKHQEAKDKLAKLEQDRAAAVEDSGRRIADARAKDLANLRAYKQEVEKLRDEIRRSQI